MDPRQQADAIDQDVSATEDSLPTLTSPESPRMRALALIEAKNRERFEQESGIKLDDQVAEQLAEPELVEAAKTEEPPAPAKVKVKVDGVEQEVDVDTLVRTYQKNSAADRRLEEAAQILRQAEQLAAQTKAAPEPAPAATPAQPPEDLKAQAAELLDKLYDGDKDSASEALVKLLAQTRGGDQPTPQPVQAVVDTDVLTSQVLERMALNTAFERVKTDYPDIIADPDLEFLAATKVTALVNQGTPRPEALITVAEGIYKTLGKTPVGRQETPPEPVKSKRQENKERLDPIPAASAAAVAHQSPAESSPSSVIAELAARRLGQSLPR